MKIPMLISEYYEQWADRKEDYLNGIDEDLQQCITSGNYHPERLDQVGNAGSSIGMATQKDKHDSNDKKCLLELRGALPPVVYNYVRGCKTAKEIWDTLKEKYQGSEKTKNSYVKE